MSRAHTTRQLLALGPLTWDQFLSATGWTPKEARRTLKQLLEQKHVVFKGPAHRGVYQLAPAKPVAAPTAADLLARIKSRCVEEGECWIWQSSVSESGLPQMHQAGTKMTSARRILWTTLHGAVDPRLMVSCTCDEKLCLNPEHLILRTRAAVVKKAAQDPSVRQKRARSMAPVARAKAKLNPEAVADIRNSSDTLHVLAARYRVHPSLISKVRRGEAWRDFSSPFAGLFQQAGART